MTQPKFIAIADHALLVSFGTKLSDETHAAVIALDQAIALDTPEGVIESVPALVNLLVDFDPLAGFLGLKVLVFALLESW